MADADIELKAPTNDQLLTDNADGKYDAIMGLNADNDGDGFSDWAGMLIYNDTNGTSSCSGINGGSKNGFVGAIYMPRDCVRFNGGADISNLDGECFMLVADEIRVIGNSRVGTSGCNNEFNTFLSAAAVGLVE